jgi:hypothetical protein
MEIFVLDRKPIFAPSFPNSIAIAFPIPVPPPVIIATWSRKRSAEKMREGFSIFVVRKLFQTKNQNYEFSENLSFPGHAPP